MLAANYNALVALLGCAMLLLISACTSHPPLKTADYVSPEQFAGDWYVVANIDYFAERNKVEGKVSYVPTSKPGIYDDIFSARDGSFDAPRKQLKGWAKSLNEQNTEYRSTFYWIIRSRFSVIHIEPNWMLLGHKNRKLAWIMARQPKLSDANYAKALQILSVRGFDTAQVKRVPQFREDIGRDGYHVVKSKK